MFSSTFKTDPRRPSMVLAGYLAVLGEGLGVAMLLGLVVILVLFIVVQVKRPPIQQGGTKCLGRAPATPVDPNNPNGLSAADLRWLLGTWWCGGGGELGKLLRVRPRNSFRLVLTAP